MLREELLDEIEVEDVLEHVDVVSSAVDNLHFERAIGLGADGGDINVWDVGEFVGSQGLGDFVDLVGDRLRGRATVGEVVLDAEVVCGT